jgi:hypothetical protein
VSDLGVQARHPRSLLGNPDEGQWMYAAVRDRAHHRTHRQGLLLPPLLRPRLDLKLVPDAALTFPPDRLGEALEARITPRVLG